MPVDATYAAAFIVGLLGGVHCAGMCGGIVGALTMGLPAALRARPVSMLPFLLAYNAGRVLSYGAAGALMGGLGYLAVQLVAVHHAQRVLQSLAGLFMVSLGLYLGGWWRGLARIEQAGVGLWRYIHPLGRRLLPVRTAPQALLLGALWGWLPCGLVYSVLIWAMTAGSARAGGLLLLSFGIGTLPTLLAMGVVYAWLATTLRTGLVRRSAGALVVLFGCYTVWLGVRP
jgi:uncharacterized protein